MRHAALIAGAASAMPGRYAIGVGFCVVGVLLVRWRAAWAREMARWSWWADDQRRVFESVWGARIGAVAGIAFFVSGCYVLAVGTW